MPKPQRQAVHQLCELYGITTISKDNEPRKYVNLYRTARTGYPAIRISDACNVDPTVTSGSNYTLAPARAWEIRLSEVECSVAGVEQAIAALDVPCVGVSVSQSKSGG
jgi:hypothetical protein